MGTLKIKALNYDFMMVFTCTQPIYIHSDITWTQHVTYFWVVNLWPASWEPQLEESVVKESEIKEQQSILKDGREDRNRVNGFILSLSSFMRELSSADIFYEPSLKWLISAVITMLVV